MRGARPAPHSREEGIHLAVNNFVVPEKAETQCRSALKTLDSRLRGNDNWFIAESNPDRSGNSFFFIYPS